MGQKEDSPRTPVFLSLVKQVDNIVFLVKLLRFCKLSELTYLSKVYVCVCVCVCVLGLSPIY